MTVVLENRTEDPVFALLTFYGPGGAQLDQGKMVVPDLDSGEKEFDCPPSAARLEVDAERVQQTGALDVGSVEVPVGSCVGEMKSFTVSGYSIRGG